MAAARMGQGPAHSRPLVAERAVALVAAHGPITITDIAGDVFDLLGHGWQRTGTPITAKDVEGELHRLAHQLEALDLITATWSLWNAGPSTRSLLPGTTLLADLF